MIDSRSIIALASLDANALDRLIPARRKGYIAIVEIQAAGELLGQPVFELFSAWHLGAYTDAGIPSPDWECFVRVVRRAQSLS